MANQFILGIDSGGTQTRAVLFSNDEAVVSVGHAGPGNPGSVGPTGARDAVAAAVRSAWEHSGREPQPVLAAVVGLAGVSTLENNEEWAADCARDIRCPSAALTLHKDVHIAQVGAFSNGPGIVLVAGTGSCGYARNEQGQSAISGGWGGMLDDAGGGYWMAMQGIIAATRAEDGRSPKTRLGVAVLEFFQKSSLREVPACLSSGAFSRDDIARFCPDVFNAALQGDIVAHTIIESGARELAVIASSLYERLFLGRFCPVALTGGLSRNIEYADRVQAALSFTRPLFTWTPPRHTPVIGAVLEAAASVGWILSSSALERANTLVAE